MARGRPWPAQAPPAIGALRGFPHATLEPSATWPMHIHEDLKGVTYVVAGALEHADNLGNRGVLTAGGVHQRWLGWGSEHEEWIPSPFAPTEFIQLWFETIQPSSHPPTTLRMSASSGGCRSSTRIEPTRTRVFTSHDTIPRPAACRTGSSRAVQRQLFVGVHDAHAQDVARVMRIHRAGKVDVARQGLAIDLDDHVTRLQASGRR